MVSQAYLVRAVVEKIKNKSYEVQMPGIPSPAWFKDVVTGKGVAESRDESAGQKIIRYQGGFSSS